METQCRKHDWASYVISKHIPSSIRKDYLTLCWFYLEMQRIEDSGNSIAFSKLDFWSQTLEDVYGDKKLAEPLSISLQHTVKNNPIPKQLLEMMIANRRMTTEFGDMSDMARYAEKNRGTFLATILCLLRMDFRDSPELLKCIELCGRSIGLADLVKKLPYALQKYKLLLPLDI